MITAMAGLLGERGTLQQMRGRGEPAPEIIDQGGLGRHFGKPRVLLHQQVFAGIARQHGRGVVIQLAVGEVEQRRLDDDVLELVHHLLFERIGAFGQCRGLRVIIHLDLLAVRRSVNVSRHFRHGRIEANVASRMHSSGIARSRRQPSREFAQAPAFFAGTRNIIAFSGSVAKGCKGAHSRKRWRGAACSRPPSTGAEAARLLSQRSRAAAC
jgi:hypothetical protein